MDTVSIARKLINKISIYCEEELSFMEVCGTHTHEISRSGIRSMLPQNLTLLSGPGCPVCVTDEGIIDTAIEILSYNDVILATFGDMVQVRGTHESIWDQLDKRKNIVIVYSPLDCLEIAKNNPEKQVVFFAVGFETTAPGIALVTKLAYENKYNNLSILTSLKMMPPVLHSILKDKQRKIHGIICPGHVATVMGAGYFRFITEGYDLSAAVCGFDTSNIAAGLYFLSKQSTADSGGAFLNLYRNCVKEEGNRAAIKIMGEVFDIEDGKWRGIGEIKKSSLIINERYSSFDALKRFSTRPKIFASKENCNCRDVLLGNIRPDECRLFGKACTPQKPSGPCMISAEGSCSAYYKYWEAGFYGG